jgi:hypothetical protein
VVEVEHASGVDSDGMCVQQLGRRSDRKEEATV